MDTGTEIRDAVRIVIEQMREHPEEFELGDGRFAWLHNTDLTKLGLNAAEVEAFNAGMTDMRYKKFNARVLDSLLADADIPTKKITLDMIKQATVALGNMQVQGNSLKPTP